MSNRAFISQVFSAFERTSTKPPKVIADAQGRSQQLLAGIVKLQSEQPPSVTHAVGQAILADRDPLTDPAVVTAVIGSHVVSEQLHNGLRANAEAHMMDVFTEHADDIVKAWRKPFDAAAAELVTAHEQIGDLQLEDSTAILRLGGDIASVWERARVANATIDVILDGWAALGMATGGASANPRTKLHRIAEVPPERMAKEFGGQPISAWQAVIAGLRLSLPTFAEMRDRVTAVEDYRQQVSNESMKPPTRPSLLNA